MPGYKRGRSQVSDGTCWSTHLDGCIFNYCNSPQITMYTSDWIWNIYSLFFFNSGKYFPVMDLSTILQKPNLLWKPNICILKHVKHFTTPAYDWKSEFWGTCFWILLVIALFVTTMTWNFSYRRVMLPVSQQLYSVTFDTLNTKLDLKKNCQKLCYANKFYNKLAETAFLYLKFIWFTIWGSQFAK